MSHSAFNFDVDKAIEELDKRPAKVASPANPVAGHTQISRISNFSSPTDWNAPPGEPTEPFNQRYMDAIKAGHPVQVWCGVFDEWVYWVRDEQIKKRLRAKGCALPIYMLSELRVVAGFDAKALRIFHEPKRAFDAVIHPPNAN